MGGRRRAADADLGQLESALAQRLRDLEQPRRIRNRRVPDVRGSGSVGLPGEAHQADQLHPLELRQLLGEAAGLIDALHPAAAKPGVDLDPDRDREPARRAAVAMPANTS